jgi:hypothetical protein
MGGFSTIGVGASVGISVGVMVAIGVEGEQLTTKKIKEHPALRSFLIPLSPLGFIFPPL